MTTNPNTPSYMATSPTEARRRKLAISTPTIPVVLIDFARTAFAENKKKNSATTAEKTARTKLLGGMRDNNIKSFNCEYSADGGAAIPLVVEIGASSRDVVNVRKLVGQPGVNLETILDHLSISKEVAETLFGSAVVAQCLVTVTGDEAASVKAVK